MNPNSEFEVPKQLVLGVAIHESNWGQSRFALEGYNFYGIRTVSKDPEDYMVPKYAPNVKVAKYLQSLTENPSGVVISLKKNIPVGAGLGGGSSNAASTLVALNKIWSLKLSREKLQKIGESFGSDVPFFVFGENAYGSGKGEILQKKYSTGKNYLIIYPNYHLSTQKMFELFDNESMTELEGNSFLNTYLKTNESVRLFYEKIAKENTISLSGSGSSMFIEYRAKTEILKILKKIPKNWRFFLCEALQYSQLREMIEDGV